MQFRLAYELIQLILEGDPGAIISVSIPIAFLLWMIIRYQVIPARKWRAPPGPVERTYYYRKKEVADEEISAAKLSWRRRDENAGTGGKPD